ncbi:hypothetical protein I3843_13G117900 [Carya illinoinensis]|nr:hypothetical protein I3843_13G117900 [Carya illinoinensis]
MDLNSPSRFCPRKSTVGDRFLGSSPHHDNTSSSSAPASSAGVELNEDDVLWTGDFSDLDHHHHSTPPSSASSNPHNNLLHNHHHKSFAGSESFGILAALPENETSPNIRNFSHLYPKASLSLSSSSSSTSTSSRIIPTIPKPSQDRMSLPSSVRYQSAPVNVPVLAKAMRRHREFDAIDDVDDDGDGEMLPPHEIVARVQSPMLACSVLEGAGRTLKGRDLRQVRNAVWRRTGSRQLMVKFLEIMYVLEKPLIQSTRNRNLHI